MKMRNGLFWPIPITLPVDKDIADSIHDEEEVALVDAETGDISPSWMCARNIRSTRNSRPNTSIAPPTEAPRRREGAGAGRRQPGRAGEGAERRRISGQISAALYPACPIAGHVSERGWSNVAAFQTRNPMHRSHEHLVKIAVEVSDGVFIHQVLGKLKAGDIPADVRTRAIQAMIDNYFRHGTVIQAGYPIEMRYAGPREALLHALIRQNFGCSHLIVGRDHAGVGSYYGPFDAHHIFDQLWEGALLTKPLKIDVTFYCRKCYGMATAKTCPHDPKYHISISGTQQREMLSSDADIPPEFSRPEVVAILKEYYAGLR